MANEVRAKQKTKVTVTITLTSLADGAARESDSEDLGATTSQRWSLRLEFEPAALLSAGVAVEVYLAWSDDGAKWPGGITGSDANWKVGDEDEWAVQLDYLGSLITTADTDGVDQVAIVGSFIPLAQHVTVLVKNESGEAFNATGGDHIVTLIPMTDEIQ